MSKATYAQLKSGLDSRDWLFSPHSSSLFASAGIGVFATKPAFYRVTFLLSPLVDLRRSRHPLLVVGAVPNYNEVPALPPAAHRTPAPPRTYSSFFLFLLLVATRIPRIVTLQIRCHLSQPGSTPAPAVAEIRAMKCLGEK